MGKKIIALHILIGILTLSYGTTNNTESSTSVTSSVSTVSKKVIVKSFRRINSTSFDNNGTVETPPVTDKIQVSFSNLEKTEILETRPAEATDENIKRQKLKKKILVSNLKNANDKIFLPTDKTEKHSVLKPIITTTDKPFSMNDNLEDPVSSTEIIKESLLKRDKEKFSRQDKNRTLVDVEIIKSVERNTRRNIEVKSFEESLPNDNENWNRKKIIKNPSVIMERTTNVYLGENFRKVEPLNNNKKHNETLLVGNKTLPAEILSGKRLTLIPRDNLKKNSITFNNEFNGPNQTDWIPIIPDYQIIRPLNDGQSFGNKLKSIPTIKLNRTTQKQSIKFPSNEQQNFPSQTESNAISFQDDNAKKIVTRPKNSIEKPLVSLSNETKTFTIRTQSEKLPVKFRGVVKYKTNQNQTNQNSSEEDKKLQNETILKKTNFSLETPDVNIPAAGDFSATSTLKNMLLTKVTNELPETTEISVVVVMSSSNTTKKSPNSINEGLVIPPSEHMKFENFSKKQEQPLSNNIAGNKNSVSTGHNSSESINNQIKMETTETIMKNSDKMNLTEIIFPKFVGKSNNNKTKSDTQFSKVKANEVETTSTDVTSEGLVTSESTSSALELHTLQENMNSTTKILNSLEVSSQNTISDFSLENFTELPDKIKIMMNGSTTTASLDYISTPLVNDVFALTTLKTSSVEEIEGEDGQNTEIKTTTAKTAIKRTDEEKKVFINISNTSPLPFFTTSGKPLQVLNVTTSKKTSTTNVYNFTNSTRRTTTTPFTAFKIENSTKSSYFPTSVSTLSEKSNNTRNIDSKVTSTLSNAVVEKAITEILPTILPKTTIKFTRDDDIITSSTSSIQSTYTSIKKSTVTSTPSTSTTPYSISTTKSTVPKLTTFFPVISKTQTSSTIATKRPSFSTTTESTTVTVPSVTTNSNKNIIHHDKAQEGIYYKDYMPSTVNPHFEITEENVPAYLRLTVEAVSWEELCSLKDDLHDAIIRMLGGSSNVSSESVHFLNLNDKNCQDKMEKIKNQDINQTVFLPVNMFLMDKKGDFDKNLSEAFLTNWGHQGLDFELPIRKVDFVTPIVNLTELAEPSLGGSVVAAIVISCVAGLCVILLGILFVIMKRRQKRFNYGQRCTPVSLDAYSLDSVSIYNSVRRKGIRASKRSYGNAAFDDPEVPTHPMNFAGLANFSADKEQLYEEFNVIPQVSPKVEELPEGAETKNRYANVIPLPETRVYLSKKDGDPLSDYINANYIRGPKGAEKFYIACQAPMESTIQDFWRMIWEEQCKVILMVTDLEENGIEKCADYLPPNEVTDNLRLFGDFQITLKKRDVKEKYIISYLKLKNMEANLWREVVHLWYLGWPDQGVPSEASSMIAFLIEARSQMKIQNGATTSSPTVVHCSPGTGRTGTVIACDSCIREYEQTRLVDIPKCVYNLRRDRAGSVQTKDQYAFIYQVLNVYATKLSGGGIESI